MSIPELLQSWSWLAWIVAVSFLLQNVVEALKNVDWIVSRFRPKPTWSNRELQLEVERLFKEISSFLYKRQAIEPEYTNFSPTYDEEEYRNRWEDYSKNISKHTQETISIFRSYYLLRIVKVREEFNRRNISDPEFEFEYKHVVNPLGIQKLLVKLAEMSAKI